MQMEQPGTDLPPAFGLARAWQTTIFLGVITLILGLIVAFHPSTSLNVIAVLIGLLMIISGIFHLIRVFDSAEAHRIWLGIAGLLLIVIGVVLIRHLHLTVALIGLIVGITWIVQGISALVTAFSGGPADGRGWWIFFGIVSLLAGIVVTAVPTTSITTIAVLIGIWFIIMGLFEIIGGFMIRHAIHKAQETMVNPPPRADEGAAAL
ncbi:MAG TPA: HdeD family acid-resistance protein [Streptosporangiaceae bacterium]|nr:HdeD family acid-resistance protein [Streptosporangiaceae bacterium]